MNKMEHIWVIDDDKSIRWVLEKALGKADMNVECFESAVGILDKLSKRKPDAIVSDIRMPGLDGLDLLAEICKQYPEIPVIIMTAHSDLDSAVSAYEGGAFEYLPKPFDINDAVELVRRAVEHSQKSSKPEPVKVEESPAEIIGEAPAMQEVFRAVGRLSRSNITVMINGESGTGKELVASALHRHSPRVKNPFIALNAAAIPKDLLESELFGHERGSFTGAQSARQGRFEQANGGTLFLDEIGDMPADLQTRLLRILATGEFYRVGGHDPVKVDVRIIAATHQDLEQRVKDGLFREDLFHRLNVIRINLPPLRDRQEDIPILLQHFLKNAAKELSVDVKKLKPEVSKFLSNLSWPGNVRQLENLCRWLTVMAPGPEVHLHDLPEELKASEAATVKTENWQDALKIWAKAQLNLGEEGIMENATPEFEKVLITTVLFHTAGRRQEAAKLLGLGRNTLTRKIKELDITES
ncbi:MAG: nitrogen regulation protein NR(I) [Gammaproteobacteria bacterium]|nr:nitrogen regulation protein NR(I) [Gammaproteobacteria bacterium]